MMIGGNQGKNSPSYFSSIKYSDSPSRLQTNSVGENKKTETSNSMIGRKIDYNLNENVHDIRSSTNTKKFPMIIETTEKRLNRQNMKFYPSTVKNSLPFEEGNYLMDHYGQSFKLVDQTPKSKGGDRKERMNTQPSNAMDQQQANIDINNLQQQSERSNENNMNLTNKSQIKPSQESKKQILVSTLTSLKPLSPSNSQQIKTINMISSKLNLPCELQSEVVKKNTKKKIVIHKKSINDESKRKNDKAFDDQENEYQLISSRIGNTENSHSPLPKKNNQKLNINSKSQENILQQKKQHSISQLKNIRQKTGIQSSKNTQRSGHSPIESPKQQKSKGLAGNASSSNLKKRSANSHLSKQRDSETGKEQQNTHETLEKSQERKKERMQKLKLLVDENIKKALHEKQKKIEDKRHEEELKKEKQMQMLQKNQLIRNTNASRFSRNKVNSNDLSRRLPWGINQEKLRNYAIQVLIQYRNQEQRSQSENIYKQELANLKKQLAFYALNKLNYLIYQKYSFQIMQRSDDLKRRKEIGLDNLSEDEIQRLIMSINQFQRI